MNIISLFLLTLYRCTSVRIRKFLEVGRNRTEAHVLACSVKSKENNVGSRGQKLPIHVYSYITWYISAVLAKVQKDDHEEGTVIKWMELILT